MGLNLLQTKKHDPIKNVYCDGGVIQKNPSLIGGTWAYVLTLEDEDIYTCRGWVTPAEIGLPSVTNNFTELLAAILAMSSLPNDYDGLLWTDSMVTYQRLIGRTPRMNGIPPVYCGWLEEQKRRLSKLGFRHLAGHPTSKELREGVNAKGLLVSKWNVACDHYCGLAAEEYLKSLKT